MAILQTTNIPTLLLYLRGYVRMQGQRMGRVDYNPVSFRHFFLDRHYFLNIFTNNLFFVSVKYTRLTTAGDFYFTLISIFFSKTYLLKDGTLLSSHHNNHLYLRSTFFFLSKKANSILLFYVTF